MMERLSCVDLVARPLSVERVYICCLDQSYLTVEHIGQSCIGMSTVYSTLSLRPFLPLISNSNERRHRNNRKRNACN